LSTTLRWRHVTLLVGLTWFLFGFFGYLRVMVGHFAPQAFINQFIGPKATISATLETSLETLLLGLGAWSILACLAPRIAILAIPWIWGTCSGRWAMRLLSSSEWHHVRYMMPAVVVVLAAGLAGYARLGSWLSRRGRAGRIELVLLWAAAASISAVGLTTVAVDVKNAPVLIDRAEAHEIQSRIRQVDPTAAVLADYEVSAPLSSRRRLYSYVLDTNLPPNFPQLGPDFQWLFIRNDYRYLKSLLAQDFEVVHRGRYLTIARRAQGSSR
jgi:hypothetical protein